MCWAGRCSLMPHRESRPALEPTGHRGWFHGEQEAGVEADYSFPSRDEVKNEWSYPSTPPICLHGLRRDKFVLYLSHLATFCAVPGTQNTTAALISAAVVFCVPTNCDQLSHFGQAECISADQITICLPCSIQINCRVRKIAPLVFIMSQIKPLLTLKLCSCKMQFNIICPSRPPTYI